MTKSKYDLLKRLYELQDLKTRGEVDKYLASWIEEVKTEAALECNESIGMNPAGKVYKKHIEKRKRKKEQYHLLKGSKRNQYVFNAGPFALRSKNDLGLPCLSTHKEDADRFLSYIDKASENKYDLRLPSITELRTYIKETKALPKEKRPTPITYDFGRGLPQFDAELLIDMLMVFPNAVGWIDKAQGSRSSMYFKYGHFDGILLPVLKKR